MKTIQKFKEKFSYQSPRFQNWFGDMEFTEDKKEIFSTVLEEDMNDEEILKELKPTPVSLGQVFNASLNKSEWNIFYCNDISGVLRTVFVNWSAYGWYVDADPVEDPEAWDTGDRVFSASPPETQTDPLTLSPSLQEAIKICQDNGLTVSKVY